MTHTPGGSTEPLRVALLSRWHVHADDYAREARSTDGIHVVRVWDEDSTRGRHWAAELGVPFEADLDRVLGDAGVDAVVVTTPTRAHREVIEAAARAGKHVFSEKILAGSTADADAILAAVDAAGIQLMLSLPSLTGSPYLAAQEALDRGDLGRLVSVRCRVAHDGAVRDVHGPGWLPERFYDAAATLGGALVDLGAHPIYLGNRLAGKPLSVAAMLLDVTRRGVDDTSALLVRYRGGVLGVLETGFANAGYPPMLELHGTEGTFLAEDHRIRVRRARAAWREVPAPAPLPSPMRQWLHAIRDGILPRITRRDMRDLTRVNEAAAQSAATKREADVPE